MLGTVSTKPKTSCTSSSRTRGDMEAVQIRNHSSDRPCAGANYHWNGHTANACLQALVLSQSRMTQSYNLQNTLNSTPETLTLSCRPVMRSCKDRILLVPHHIARSDLVLERGLSCMHVERTNQLQAHACAPQVPPPIHFPTHPGEI
jgi:hypothetical protein